MEKTPKRLIGRKFNVLSLFDGISCGRLALERAGIPIQNYFASEIDKSAIKISQYHYPDNINLGDIRYIETKNLPKIDILIGGSPCQGFSFAGKQLNFNDERSRLFFEYVRIFKACNPTYFLLENVVMKQEFQDVISNIMGVEPIKINSNLLSAQNRNRLYWTNIPFKEIKARKINLSDILINDKNYTPARGEYRVSDILNADDFSALAVNKKAIQISGTYPHTFTESRTELGKMLRKSYREQNGRDTTLRSAEHRIYTPANHNKANCLVCVESPLNLVRTKNCVRYLTSLERERLQTVPDFYTAVEGMSDYKRNRLLGNGWTVNVIAHILSGIGKRPVKTARQQSILF